MYEWKEFRKQYQNCAELHSLFPGVPIMALTATAVPTIATKLKYYLNDPLILTSTVIYFLLVISATSKKLRDQADRLVWRFGSYNHFARSH